jgi:hypothetical protein
VLLIFLMVLFPPRAARHRSAPALDTASYRAPPRDESLSAARPAGPAVAAPTIAPPTGASPAATSPTGAPPTGGTPAAASRAPQHPSAPVAATLQLARPEAAGATGLSGIDPALMGRTYQHEMLMDGFKVPLPPGDWVVLASSTIKVIKHPENTGMNYFLGQIEHARLTAAMIVIALRSGTQPQTGYEEWERCTSPTNISSVAEDMTPFGHQACWIMHTMFAAWWQQWADKAVKMGNLERAAAGDMAAKGVSYPQDLIAVHFFRAETWGLLEVSYLFSPEHDHIASNVVPTLRDSDWFGASVQKYPEKLAYIDKLKHWGEAHWPQFKAAFDAGR